MVMMENRDRVSAMPISSDIHLIIFNHILSCSIISYCQEGGGPPIFADDHFSLPGNPVQPGEACTGHIAGGRGSHGGCAEEVPWLGQGFPETGPPPNHPLQCDSPL